jgi:hypothetical protein
VLDCVFHASIKDRMKDAEFKAFIFGAKASSSASLLFKYSLPELALQRVEARSSIPLSRQIGTPNIRSKGSLLPRTVLIPPALYPPGHPQRSAFDAHLEAKKNKKLVEEIEPAQPPKGILKKTTKSHASTVSGEADASGEKEVPLDAELPAWTWSRDETGLKIRIQVPTVVRVSVCAKTARALLTLPRRGLTSRLRRSTSRRGESYFLSPAGMTLISTSRSPTRISKRKQRLPSPLSTRHRRWL